VQNVIKLLGLNEADYLGPDARPDAKEDLDESLRQWMAVRSAAEALEQMRELEVVAERIFDVEDILKSELYAQRKDVISIEDHELGPVRMAGVVPKFRMNPGAVWRTGPSLGADSREVYRELLDMSDTEFDRLRSLGVV